MLSTGVIGVPDCPLSPYALPAHATLAVLTARLAVEAGLGDQVAWAAQFDAPAQLRIAAPWMPKGKRRARRRH